MAGKRTSQGVGLLVVATVVAGLLWMYVTDRGLQSEPAVEAVDHPGSTRPISSAPLAPRIRTHAAWSGKELLVWSGVEPNETRYGHFDVLDDGAAYDPTSNSWRKLPTAPISGRAGAAVVWTGDRLVIWGGFSRANKALQDGAAYLPDQNVWVGLPPAPIAGRGDTTAVWTGQEVLIVGGAESAGRPGHVSGLRRDGAAYDPAANRWRVLPSIPDGVWQLRDRGVGPIRERFAGTWAGKALVVWGRDIALYDPDSNAWDRVTAPHTAMWLGGRVTTIRIGDAVAVIGLARGGNPETFGITYSPKSGAFGSVPALSRAAMTGSRQVVAAGDLVVLLSNNPTSAAVWRPGTTAWRSIPADLVRGSEAPIVWTGEEVLIWGGSDDSGSPRADGIAWSP